MSAAGVRYPRRDPHDPRGPVLQGLVSERVPLEQVNETVEHVRSGAVARSVIVFDSFH